MKSSEFIFENPYLNSQEFNDALSNVHTSYQGLSRENDSLGALIRSGTEYNFWLSKSRATAKVSTAVDDDPARQRIVCEIRFQVPAELPVTNPLQVRTVFTDVDYRTQWLGGILYVVLAKYGYSVISDFEQSRSGAELWRKIGEESSAVGYVVRIFDDQREDWIRDKNNQPVKYNAANIPSADIWKDVSQKHQPTTLLVLTKD